MNIIGNPKRLILKPRMSFSDWPICSHKETDSYHFTRTQVLE